MQIFDKFRTDVVTLTVLQKLVEDKEKELQNLTSKKEVADFASKQIWIWVYLQILLIIKCKKIKSYYQKHYYRNKCWWVQHMGLVRSHSLNQKFKN